MSGKDSPPLDGSEPLALGKWIATHGSSGNYLLAIASGWPNGLERFKRHVVQQQCDGANLSVDDFMVQLMTFAFTGELTA